MENEPKITSEKVGETFLISISDTEVTISGSQLLFAVMPQMTDEQKNELKNVTILADSEEYINIANQSIGDLVFKSCEITVTQPIDFRGSKITFAKCDLTQEFEINGGHKYKTEDIRDGQLTLEGRNIISAQNIHLTIDDVLKVEFNDQSNASINLDAGTLKPKILGSIGELLFLNGRDIAVSGAKSTTIAVLVLPNKIAKLSNIVLGSNTSIKYTLAERIHSLAISGLNEMSDFRLKDTTFDLHIENTELDKTNIFFEGNATVHFKKFESIATSWNPSSITYRDFCPTIGKYEKKPNVIPAKEFFCEMKTHFSNRGDSIRAAEFYAAEMKAYQYHLSVKHKGNALHPDRVALLLAFESSNFSQNWYLPILWYLLFGIYFADVLLFVSHLYDGFLPEDFESAKFLYNILSPLTIDYDSVTAGLHLSPWFVFPWLLWKIIAGYLIYQMVVSSRRFVRKW